MAAIDEIKKDLTDCTKRMTQAKVNLSSLEDNVNKAMFRALERKIRTMQENVIDMETRYLLNNKFIVV